MGVAAQTNVSVPFQQVDGPTSEQVTEKASPCAIKGPTPLSLAADFSKLNLPRVDFDALLVQQLNRAMEFKTRVLGPRSWGQWFLDIIEGPWAPAKIDMPVRLDRLAQRVRHRPFRKEVSSPNQITERRALKDAVRRSEKRWSLSQWTSVYEYNVPIRKLPESLEGFSILHLSDIHFLRGNDRSVRELAHVARYLEAGKRKIDAILISGDVITRSPDDLSPEALLQLRRISAVCPQSFMVYGNHDYHGHMPAVISRELERVGFHDINNHHVRVSVGGAALNIFGIDDAYFGEPRPPRHVNRDEINLVLTHNLDAIRHDFPGDIDLILSGHTHWGEVRWFDGAGFMRRWGYCDNLNKHTKQWDVLSERTLSFVHPGLARYYVPYRGVRHPPGVVIHTLCNAPSLQR